MNLEDCFVELFGSEGGYSNRDLKDDPGGETNFGITKATLLRAIKDGLVPSDTTVKTLTRDQAKTIYRKYYWDECMCDQLPSWLRMAVFDAAVNSGPKQSSLWLQEAIGAGMDGKIGPKTIGLARQSDPGITLCRVLGIRLQAMTEMSNWQANARGWSRRVARLLRGSQNV